MKKPITIYVDSVGNEIISDGNHRGYNAEVLGMKIRKKIIGKIAGDVSNDPDYRPVSNLKVLEASVPFSDR